MRRACWIAVWAVLIVGVLAPLLANDVPLVARAGGELHFPAFRSCFGEAGLAPGDRLWKEWWIGLRDGGADWAIMPPVIWGPSEGSADAVLALPTFAHPLGNDDIGRDQLARLIHGARTAAIVALGTVLLAMALGVALGAVAGGFGGWLDVVVLRVIEVFLCFPALLAVLAAAAFFGGSLTAVILVLAAVYWVAFARVVRGEFLSLREREFVQAARGLGVGPARLLLRHMLPCVKGPVLVTAAFVAAEAIVVESSLSYLGLGLGLDSVSWGAMLARGKANAHTGAWHLWVFPTLAVAVVVLGLHGLADESGARDAVRAKRPPGPRPASDTKRSAPSTSGS